MESSNRNIVAMSDKTLLELIGNFIRENRVRQRRTQQEVAVSAGINRSTLVRLESGGGGNILTFVQVLRAIDQLYVLKNFEVREQISPLLLAKMQQGKRQRGGYLSKLNPLKKSAK